MARARTATEDVAALGRDAVQRALVASDAAGSMKAFYAEVGMRNPSRSYFVRYAGRLHSLKAVVAHALRQTNPVAIARGFHAIDGAARLRELKFDVVHDADTSEEERERVWISRLARRLQPLFRERLIDLYGRCPLSGCTTLRALEAAHVNPVARKGIDTDGNGILLRADLHKLFDADLLAIDPADGRVHVSPSCEADYGNMLRNAVFTPPPGGPDLKAFAERWSSFQSFTSTTG